MKLLFCFFLSSLFCITLSAQKVERHHKHHGLNKRVFYGTASFYADKFNGRRTASGEIFRQNKLTCACNMLPFGTYIKVTNVHNDKWAIVKVNDRLHPKMKCVADLTKATALKLGYKDGGSARVKIEVIEKNKS